MKGRKRIMKWLEWNKRAGSVFIVASVLMTALTVALYPREMTITENMTLEPVVWSFQRPSANQYVIIDKTTLQPRQYSDCVPRAGSLNYDTQTLFVSCFLSDHPQELRLVRNVRLLFTGISGLPVNTSLSTFQDRFVGLEYALTPEVGKFFITFNIFFDLSIDNETAGFYADEIINEFLNTFGYEGLRLLWESHGPFQSQMVVHKSFGYMQYTRDNVSAFLKFKPTEGFGTFIDSLLNKYVPGNDTTGLTASYWLERTESKLEWSLRVSGVSSSLIPWYPHDYSIVIDVNELLGNDLSKIQPSPNQQIEISIETNKTLMLTKGLTTYTTTIESIQPEGYTISNINGSDRVEVKCETLPREDIVIKIIIDSSIQSQFPFDDLQRLALYVIVTISTCLIVYLILKVLFPKGKRKRGEKGD